MSTPRMCQSCGRKPQAYHGRCFCYDCKPGTKGRPLACRRCGSTDDYYSEGLCRRCHWFAPQQPDSCRDCLAWGATRTLKWLCGACLAWRNGASRSPTTLARCIACGQQRHVNQHMTCRLCWNQAKRLREPGQPLDVIAANRHGQQLMLADMSSPKKGYSKPRPAPPRPPAQPRYRPRRQLSLLARQPIIDAARHRGYPDPPDNRLAASLDQIGCDYAASHGWSEATTRSCRIAIRVLLGMRGTAQMPIRASEVTRLSALGLPVGSVLSVLTEADLLIEDRLPAIRIWFDQQIRHLPEPMAGELRTWFNVLHQGSPTPPRSRPRAEVTIKTRILWAMPTLTSWAEAGQRSLREITRDHVLAVLPARGTPRATLGRALRSIFATLKAHKAIFINPTTRIRIGPFERRTPLPANHNTLRAALNSPDQATATLAALAIFHGLRPSELSDLRLDHIHDGRLHLADRTVLLADPVKTRLSAYLDYRTRRWPTAINPHVFIHDQNATKNASVRRQWINTRLGISVQAVRQDRIVDEAIATAGDLRRICDLFGVTIATAQHYVSVLDHPGLIDPTASTPARGSRTEGAN